MKKKTKIIQLYDCQKYHGQVRQDCVNFMRKNKILFENVTIHLV